MVSVELTCAFIYYEEVFMDYQPDGQQENEFYSFSELQQFEQK